jgi:hypothetical protein
MNHNNSHKLLHHCLALLLFLLTTLVVTSPLLAHNEPPARPEPELPVRPVLDCRTRSLDNCHETDNQDSHIKLVAQGAQEGAQSVVQWQGGDGEWHDVEGWRGTLAHGQVRWFVEEADLGKGPFRWQVEFTQPVTQTLVSESFMLPDAAGNTVTITIAQK